MILEGSYGRSINLHGLPMNTIGEIRIEQAAQGRDPKGG